MELEFINLELELINFMRNWNWNRRNGIDVRCLERSCSCIVLNIAIKLPQQHSVTGGSPKPIYNVQCH